VKSNLRVGELPRFFKLLMENNRSRANDIAKRGNIMQPHEFPTVSGTAVAVAMITSSQALAEMSVEPMHPAKFKALRKPPVIASRPAGIASDTVSACCPWGMLAWRVAPRPLTN
jgi:hypothetical protein